jgi:hypothetical protein
MLANGACDSTVNQHPLRGLVMAIDHRGEKFSGYNKPKRTPDHPKKSHAVLAKEGDKVKLIRFGEQGASTAGKPKSGESDRMKKKRSQSLRPDTLRILRRVRCLLPTGR